MEKKSQFSNWFWKVIYIVAFFVVLSTIIQIDMVPIFPTCNHYEEVEEATYEETDTDEKPLQSISNFI